MLPQYQDDLRTDFKVVSQPNKTYRLNLENSTVNGRTDGLEAVKQAVFLILSTPRFLHEIYSWNYGVELTGLIGRAIPLVYSNIENNIKEALLQDDRIKAVRDFTFAKDGNRITASFTVESEYGEIEMSKEVIR